MLITEEDTNLGGSETLLGELDHKLVDLLVAGLEPAGGTAAIRQRAARDAFSRDRVSGWGWERRRVPGCVHTAHGEKFVEGDRGGANGNMIPVNFRILKNSGRVLFYF